MPLFYFDIDDGVYSTEGAEAIEFANTEAARRGVVSALAEIAANELPNGGSRTFRAVIRDPDGRDLFEAVLEFRSRWL
ncbi:MAG: hypothetical protein K5872_12135 [Rhizobiaceae bacterium]|nr:hypothetical protein [Rhizobiaceae bacterium]MCV0406965.1 hypothetical protein [Rhizobiaceae bacterium]